MSLDHEAIRKAYSNAVTIDDSTGAFDANGNEITLDDNLVTAARTTLNNEAAAIKYKTDRTTNGSTTYGSWREQMAMLYDDIVAGKLDSTGTFFAHNKAVKDANPKPS
tara:strand:- start:779 stop:1102 length:324 start_codon:yes stop_codon:yes gene_type:complete